VTSTVTNEETKLVGNICKEGVLKLPRAENYELENLHVKKNYFIINSSIALVISITTLVILLFIIINRE
jgi:hypothetical protein